jgi:hypothetical protein
MATELPTVPEVGLRLLITGGVTVKVTPALATPATVTMTFPVVAPAGTVVTIPVLLQLDTPARTPLKFTVLEPCAEPKPNPEMVTVDPTRPAFGERLEITGFAETEKATGAVATPLIVKTTFPVVNPAGG